jgi:hypothetical protein
MYFKRRIIKRAVMLRAISALRLSRAITRAEKLEVAQA